MSPTSDAARISPTAHYTGAVWAAHRLGHPAFQTREGRLLRLAAAPAMQAARRLGGPTLDGLLLARHRLIDEHLHAAIRDGRVSQVIEIAAGLSPRGWRLAREYGERLCYVEADLPAMAARKQALLDRVGRRDPDRHRVVPIDAFAADGPESLAAIAARLDPARGTAIITEGLINYFPQAPVRGLWQRIATTLRGFPHGLYLSDLHIAGDNRHPAVRLFVRALSVFVQGQVFLHFDSADAGLRALDEAGFDHAELLKPADHADRHRACADPAARLVRIVVARTGPARAAGTL